MYGLYFFSTLIASEIVHCKDRVASAKQCGLFRHSLKLFRHIFSSETPIFSMKWAFFDYRKQRNGILSLKKKSFP